jgi:hypothetical protein
MSRVGFNAVKTGIATGTSAKTLMQIIAAANHRVALSEIGVSFQGTSATDPPVLIEVLRQTTTGTVSALTLVKSNNSDDETIQTTASHTASAEPTAGDILMAFTVHPQAGFVWQAPPGGEIIIPGGGKVGIRATTSTTQTAAVTVKGEE